MAARSKNKHRLHHWFEYALARCLIAFTWLLPRPLLYGVFSTVSRLWAVLDRRHRSITLRNASGKKFDRIVRYRLGDLPEPLPALDSDNDDDDTEIPF